MKERYICSQLDHLSLGLTTPTRFIRTNHVNSQLIDRLGLETSLQGHQGCVNCLEWNERGTHLASGSDDCRLILWDPFERKNVFTMNTGHVGNIFAVKFLPNLNEHLVVTGAADARVRVHDISRMETRHVFSCHTGRIKRMANTPSEPFLFWSAAEDGTVRQFDLRDPNAASSTKPRNVLVNLHNHIGSFAEAKCLALNPLKPELMAVGSNDPYVRVYDRRKITLTAFSEVTNFRTRRYLEPHSAQRKLNVVDYYMRKRLVAAGTMDRLIRKRMLAYYSPNQPSGGTSTDTDAPSSDEANPVTANSIRYFVPGHLPSKEVNRRGCFSHMNVTCVSFSPDGQSMLANMSGDHIYLFACNKTVPPYQCATSRGNLDNANGLVMAASSSDQCLTPWSTNQTKDESSLSVGRLRIDHTAKCSQPTSPTCPAMEQGSLQAARLVKARAFVAAVRAYNDLINRWPSDPQLYTGRATALLKRGWNGDVYSALLDCQTTLALAKPDQGNADSETETNTLSTQHHRVTDCIRVTALLLSARCLLRLDWIAEARTMLDHVRNHYGSLIRKVPSASTTCCTSKSETKNGVRVSGSDKLNGRSTVESHDTTKIQSEPSLYRFLHVLDGDIRTREKAINKEQSKKSADCGDVKKTSKEKASSDEEGEDRDPTLFLREPAPADTTSQPDSTSDTNRDVSSGVTERDVPDTGRGNDADDSWTPIWLTEPSAQRQRSTGKEKTSADQRKNATESGSTCSCLGCLTAQSPQDETMECTWRAGASDHSKRFIGHCNSITDIKEANFFGSDGQYVVAGSDCGSFFIWDRESTNTVRILEADSSTVNCVQPHPSICLLASSGIDSVVRLWAPLASDDSNNSRLVTDHVGAAERNQRRSIADPLEIMLLNVGYRIPWLNVSEGNSSHRRSAARRRGRPNAGDRQRSNSSSSDNESDEEDVRNTDLLSRLQTEFHEDEDGSEPPPSHEEDEEDYDNPDDVDDLPVARGATFYSTRDPPLTDRDVTELNGVHQSVPTVDAAPNIGRRPTERTATGTRTHKSRKRLRSDRVNCSTLQPPIALSALDDFSSSSTSDSDNHTATSASQNGHLRPRTSRRNHTDGNNESDQASSLLSLRSVLHAGDRFVIYSSQTATAAAAAAAASNATGGGSNSAAPSAESGTDSQSNRNTSSSVGDDDESALLEVPCTMS